MQILVANFVNLELFGFAMSIKNMEIEADKALLFNEEYVTWGEMQL